MSKTLRLYGKTHDELKEITHEDETFDDALNRILPDDPEVVERPEDEVVAVTVSDETHEKVIGMAGQNVNVSNVIQFHINRYKRPESII